MNQVVEKRGPIEKSDKGWPINPFGAVALFIFALIIIFLIIRPLLSQKTENLVSQNSSGGRITEPLAGEIVKEDSLQIELSVDEPQKVQKVQFWAKTYADGKWQMIGEAPSSPYKLDWQIPQEFKNKAIAVTSHIYTQNGDVIKDPGGWREGIIILSDK